MSSGFTRQEALAITGITPGRLSYLDKTGLVSPEKIGDSKHPRVIYSVGQIIELKVISRLREKLSLQEIRKVIEFLKSRNYEPSLFDCKMIFVDSELYLIESWEAFGIKVLRASGKNKGLVDIQDIGKIGEVISDLKREAEKHKVLDFEKRIIGTPLAVV